MRSRSVAVAAVSSALVLATGGLPAFADDIEAFYKGRTIEMVVASAVGGGYDAYARMVSKHMGKHIPGQPNFVVRNMPGAGAINATLYLANVAVRDGSVILANQPGALGEPVFGDKGKPSFDPLSFGHIGSVASFTTLCVIRRDSKVGSFAELQKTEAVFGGDQIGSTTYDHSVIFKNLAGIKIKMVTGYKGTSDLVLSLQRGEIEGFCGYAWSSLFSRTPELVTNNVVRMIVQYGLEPLPEATKAGVPQIWEFVTDPENKAALELIAALQQFGRPFMTTTGVPAERLAALRKAFDATMKDPEFLADMDKSKLDVAPITGEQVTRLVRGIIEAPKAVQEKARNALILK